MDSNSVVEQSHFQQQNYLFLFDKEIGFSMRDQKENEEHNLTATDYCQMIEINRRVLCQFLSKHGCKAGDDAVIDQQFKMFLQVGSNGQYLKPDIVAHIEYFMNTLNMDLKGQTENPFEDTEKYAAFQFKQGEGTDVIMEQDSSSDPENENP